ncbi:MAG: DNA gyrase subunit A [Methanomicrobiales archaeon]|nr:DNA gyrase subunit A [Methanomicrobiales archaeon]
MISEGVVPINIEEEMKSCYIDYAMSVIIGRAIPDARDGLKPVHRRTLYAMWEMGNTSDKPYKKSARVVGDVMGKYHPHGDSAIYDTLVKMAQPFSYRYMLVDGQGNFGSIDGDSAAAMRYTEARLTKISEELLTDINKDTVDFVPNFDESLQEPDVLPARVPNLLVNGSSGIAVGMATNMPPHNLREVCEATCRIIDEPGTSTQDLMQIMPGPDFPTGGIIMGSAGVRDAYLTGRGRCVVRGVAEIEEEGRTPQIIITEIPFQVNKARLIEHIATLVRDKRIEGISDIRDESDRDGMRVVIDIRKGVAPQVILNYLYKHTALESTFGIINLAIVDRQPRTLNLKEMIQEFLKHRVEVVRRRTEFDLRKAEERMHILRGLLIALDNIDAVVATIRASRSAEEAQAALVAKFALDEVQADAILKMQLRRLAALEQQKILDERDALADEIGRLSAILESEANILAEIRKELVDISTRFGDERRTQIGHVAEAFDKEDLIEDKSMLVSITSSNYIKRIDLDTYRNQRRGGRGVIGMATKDDDGVENVFVANMHDYLLCFTDKGRVYWLKVYDLPEGQRASKGKAIVNLLNLDGGERVTAVIPVREFDSDHYLFFATRAGTVVKVALDEFSRPRQTGINAITLRDDDELVDVKVTDGDMELILTTRFGQSLRFHEEAVRPVRRNAMGVRGIRLRHGDTLQAISLVEKDHLLTITEQGYGKRTEFDEFRGHGRGTMGVRNIVVDARGGGVIGSRAVLDSDEIIVMSASGIVIRTKVEEISIQKRSTRGVRIMKLDDGDRVIGFTILDATEEDGE